VPAVGSICPNPPQPPPPPNSCCAATAAPAGVFPLPVLPLLPAAPGAAPAPAGVLKALLLPQPLSGGADARDGTGLTVVPAEVECAAAAAAAATELEQQANRSNVHITGTGKRQRGACTACACKPEEQAMSSPRMYGESRWYRYKPLDPRMCFHMTHQCCGTHVAICLHTPPHPQPPRHRPLKAGTAAAHHLQATHPPPAFCTITPSYITDNIRHRLGQPICLQQVGVPIRTIQGGPHESDTPTKDMIQQLLHLHPLSSECLNVAMPSTPTSQVVTTASADNKAEFRSRLHHVATH